MSYWLLRDDVLEAIQTASAASLQISAEQTLAFEASARRSLLQTGNQVATIPVVGTLTPRPDLLAFLFGGGNTAYSQIVEALAEAQNDPTIGSVELHVNSPGGSVDGLFETIAAVEAFTKPIKVRASQAASAAYALAAVAGPIEATSVGSSFGSIGVAVSTRVAKDTVTLTSTDAPDKRPDPMTAEGQATIRSYLDAVHSEFVEAIARGRSTSAEALNATRGGTFLAKDALSKGLIDSISEAKKASRKQTTASKSGGISTESVMDLKELKAQFPAVYEAAVQLGRDEEFEQVAAHLKLGAACGDLSIAVSAIEGRKPFTSALVQAEYQAAGLNRRDIQARQADSQVVAQATQNIATKAADKDFGDLLAEAVLGAETK